jgi:predicted ATP-grasp superfamily ATP-dependent carboligase
VGGVDSLKKEAEEIKNSLKEFVKRERQREINYKKQQAYLL